jgi:hypothetical protein
VSEWGKVNVWNLFGRFKSKVRHGQSKGEEKKEQKKDFSKSSKKGNPNPFIASEHNCK